MNKIIPLAVAVATVFSVPTANAAIDDAGMRYVSASEGFGGSLRVNVLKDTSGKDAGVHSTLGGTRLWVQGDVDLGGGFASMYYWEWRTGDDKEVKTDSVHAGLKGPFGEIRAGIVEPAASAMIPSPDVMSDVGVNDSKLFGTSPNTIRWMSPDINGLKVGAAVMMKDNAGDDDAVDAFDIAATYTLPQGVSLGAGYESVNAPGSTSDDKMKKSGFRVGGQYGQDNWLIAYNYRNYDNFVKYVEDYTESDFEKAIVLDQDVVDQLAYEGGTVDDSAAEDVLAFFAADQENYVKDFDYDAHSLSAKVDVDKFTFAVGYQKEEIEYSGKNIIVVGEVIIAPAVAAVPAVIADPNASPPVIGVAAVAAVAAEKFDAGSVILEKGSKAGADTFTFDVAYNLASHAKVILAYQTVDIDDVKDNDSKTYLLYRVDF